MSKLPRSTEESPRRARAEGSRWPLFVALAATVSLLHGELRHLFDGTSALLSFEDRAIGMTTLRAVDASGYVHNYVRLQILLLVVFLACFFVARRLRSVLDRVTSPTAKEHLWIARLAEIWLAVASLGVIFASDARRSLEALLAYLALAALVVLAARHLLRRLRPGSPFLGLGEGLVVGTLFWPFSVILGFQVLRGDAIGFGGGSLGAWITLHAVLWLACLAAASRLTRRSTVRSTPGQAASRLLLAALPLLFLPASLPFANELQARFVTRDPRHLALWIFAGLWLAAIALYFGFPRFVRRRGLRLSPLGIVHAVYFPLFLGSAALLHVHRHVLQLSRIDYFHLGEKVLPTHQLFAFGKVPVLDLRPSHTFSDFVYPALYTLFHGPGWESGAPLDMLAWERYLPHVLTLLLAYFVLARAISPAVGFLVVAMLPILLLVPVYFHMPLLVALCLARAVERPSFGRYLALWGSVLVLLLWRIDFGLFGGLAAVAFAVSSSLDGSLRPVGHRWRAALRSLGVVLGFGAGVLLVLVVVRGISVLATLRFFFTSYTYRLLTRTRPEVFHEYGLDVVLQYYVLPAVALVVLGHFAVGRLLRRQRLGSHHYLLGFVAAFALMASVRTMERHSLWEGFKPSLFPLLLGLLPVLLVGVGQRRERLATRLPLIALLVAVLSLRLATSLGVGDCQITDVFERGTLFRFHAWEEGERRVVFPEEKHAELLAFFEEELGEGETFFDFTNSPLLYVLADRPFPTYVIPNLLHTSETVQAHVLGDLERLLRADRLPFVIFKQGHGFWDANDGVPNEVRSYRLAEFVYRHWEPRVRFGGYEIWGLQDGSRDDAPGDETVDVPEPVQRFDLLRLPGVWARLDPLDARRSTPVLATLLDEPVVSLRPGGELVLSFDPAVDKSRGNYLHLEVDPVDAFDKGWDEEPPRLRVSYGDPPENAFTFELMPPGTAEEGTVAFLEPTLFGAEMVELPTDRAPRWIFRPAGADPRVENLLDVWPLGTSEDVFLRLEYRSLTRGTLRLVPGLVPEDGGPLSFRPELGMDAGVRPTGPRGAPGEILYRLPTDAPGRLANLRIHLPDGLFEIVGARWLRPAPAWKEYLIRLSTQWRWTSTPVDRLRLEVVTPPDGGGVPVVVRGAWLRGGD